MQVGYFEWYMVFEFALILLILCVAIHKILKRRFCTPNYNGKVIWITGASSGIGQALVYQFNRKGGKVIISARNEKQLDRVKNQCQHPQKIEIVKMDITKYDQVTKITENVLQKLKSNNQKLDVVVENAGVSMRCQFTQYPFANYKKLLDVNVHGPCNHIKSFIKHMIQQGQGQIVGVSSIASRLATPYRFIYAGSKNALTGLLDSLRLEMSPYNITVTNIMPGYTKTNISKNAFAANEGEKFGQTDNNIKNGMDPSQFAKQAVKVIYRRENQAQISNQWYAPWAIALRFIIPDLIFFGIRLKTKNQSKATKKPIQQLQSQTKKKIN